MNNVAVKVRLCVRSLTIRNKLIIFLVMFIDDRLMVNWVIFTLSALMKRDCSLNCR